MRAVAEKYQLIQLGLCFFLNDTKSEEPPPEGKHKKSVYMAYPFNIYLFPEECSGSKNEIVFDIDTVNFHKQQKLDFNKWIYEGVPYITLKNERMQIEKILEIKKPNFEDLKASDNDLKKLSLIFDGINNWIETDAKKEYLLSGLTNFQRKYVYQRLTKEYPLVYFYSKQCGKFDKEIVLRLVKTEEKVILEKEKRDAEMKDVYRRTGALRLFKMLIELKIPIIGHNPGFDLMFIYSHLCDELPKKWSDFKKEIAMYFPKIYDTMLIFSDDKVKKLLPEKQSSALEAIYLFLSKSAEMSGVTINTEPGNKYSKDDHYHEAGYDAYITGYCFAKMMGYLNKEEFESYMNQLYAHRSPFNMNLSTNEILHDNV